MTTPETPSKNIGTLRYTNGKFWVDAPPPVATRMKFLDGENKVLVKDFGELVDSAPINDAKEVFDSALGPLQDAQKSLQALQTPLSSITQQLNSGEAASEMMNSITQSVNTNLPELRSVSASITAVTNNTMQYASEMTQSVMGSVNSAVASVPGVIGKVSEISSGVKSELLKSSVQDFTSSASNLFSAGMASAKNALSSLNAVSQTADQAARSIAAAKQSVSSISNTLNVFNQSGPSSLSLPQISNQALTQRIQQTISNTTSVNMSPGTSSQLPPVTSSAYHTPTAEPIPQLSYSDKAITFLIAAATWYRGLSSLQFQNQIFKIKQNYGEAKDHYAALNDTGTELQQEQLSNFQTLMGQGTPDPSSKNFYIYQTLQNLFAYLADDLQASQSLQTPQRVLFHLNKYLPRISIKALMASDDYDSVTLAVSDILYGVRTNYHGLTTQASYDEIYQQELAKLITDTVLYHRGSPTSITKTQEAPSQIAVFCATLLLRDLLELYIASTDPQVRVRCTHALTAIYNTPMESLRYSYTDTHGLVLSGQKIYWRPSTDTVLSLTYPLFKHYHHNRVSILAARESLVSEQEKSFFDKLVVQTDAIIGTRIQPVLNIEQNTDKLNYLQLSNTHKEIGERLASEVLQRYLDISDTAVYPDKCFEAYSTSVSHLYLDESVAFMR